MLDWPVTKIQMSDQVFCRFNSKPADPMKRTQSVKFCLDQF